MKKLILFLLVLFALSIPAYAQTFTHVGAFVSGASTSGGTTSVATASTSVTAGNLIACMYGDAQANVGGQISIADTAGNQFIFGGGGDMGVNFNGSPVPFYSITTASNASDVVTVTTSTSQAYQGLSCDQWSVTSGYHFVVDANNVGSSGATSTTITSNAFTTHVNAEVVFGCLFRYLAGTLSAGTIGGNSATLQAFNGSNGSTSLTGIETYVTSSTISGGTATASLTASLNNLAFVLSFSASNVAATTPVFAASTYVANSGSNSASITSPAIKLLAGQFALVHCAADEVTVTGITATSSPSNTWSQLTLRSVATQVYVQDSYNANVGAGSTTFTCTPNTSAQLSMIVLVYSGVATTSSLDVQAGGTAAAASTVTSSSFSTSQNVELIIACASGPGSGISWNGPWTPGLIGSPTATLRQISNYTATGSSAKTASDGCEDTITSTTQSTITAAISNVGASATMVESVAAFKPLSTFAPTWVGPFSYGLN